MNNMLRILVVIFLIVLSQVSFAAPSADALKFWTAFEAESNLSVSHDAWQSLLDTYLSVEDADGVNRFDYGAVTKVDAKKLESYLDSLQKTDPRTLSRDEQLPYWINFYNALTVKVVLDEYPVSSIRDIRFLTSPFGPWDKNLVTVAGEDLSLNDIEHGILRPIWQDPRIHFSVNCASIGCPNLAPKVFTSKNADALMESSAIDFINHARGVKIGTDSIVLSSIFDWYGSDFGENKTEILSYLARYYAGDDKQGLQRSDVELQFQYDWGLNKAN